MDDLLEQPFRPRASLDAYRQAYAELDGDVISLDLDDDDDPPQRRVPLRGRKRTRAPSSREARAS
ncbi:MAG: hypothetical protein R3F62_02170 [Planctomycetota bacterium]